MLLKFIKSFLNKNKDLEISIKCNGSCTYHSTKDSITPSKTKTEISNKSTNIGDSSFSNTKSIMHNQKITSLLDVIYNKSINFFESSKRTDKELILQQIPLLIQQGYIIISSSEEALQMITIKDLKKILKEHNLKISGSKIELISRIKASLSLDEINQIGKNFLYYKLTSRGESLLNQYKQSQIEELEKKNKAKLEYTNLTLNVFNYISDENFNGAFKLVAEYEKNQEYPRGLGFDWNQSYGLSSEDNTAFIDLINFDDVDNNIFKYYGICSYLLGIDAYKCAKLYLSHYCKLYNLDTSKEIKHILTDKIYYYHSLICSFRDMDSYYETDVTKYEFLIADDDSTCTKCRKKDSKVFRLSSAEIGKNFPPFHEGCRCTTTPYFDD